MMDKVTRQCPQTTTFLKRKENEAVSNRRSFRLPTYRLTARPNRLTRVDVLVRSVFKSSWLDAVFPPQQLSQSSQTQLIVGVYVTVFPGPWPFNPFFPVVLSLFDWAGILWPQIYKAFKLVRWAIVQELCESRGGRPGLSVLTSLPVSVDVKIYCTVLRHWSQLVPNMSHDIWGH